MESLMGIILVICFMLITIFMQVKASKTQSAFAGLIIPLIIFMTSILVLIADRGEIDVGKVLNFSLYNIPTILFLCIYNYCKRRNRR